MLFRLFHAEFSSKGGRAQRREDILPEANELKREGWDNLN